MLACTHCYACVQLTVQHDMLWLANSAQHSHLSVAVYLSQQARLCSSGILRLPHEDMLLRLKECLMICRTTSRQRRRRKCAGKTSGLSNECHLAMFSKPASTCHIHEPHAAAAWAASFDRASVLPALHVLESMADSSMVTGSSLAAVLHPPDLCLMYLPPAMPCSMLFL